MRVLLALAALAWAGVALAAEGIQNGQIGYTPMLNWQVNGDVSGLSEPADGTCVRLTADASTNDARICWDAGNNEIDMLGPATFSPDNLWNFNGVVDTRGQGAAFRTDDTLPVEPAATSGRLWLFGLANGEWYKKDNGDGTNERLMLNDANVTGDITCTQATGQATCLVGADKVALGTDTTGDYIASATCGAGTSCTATGEGSTPTIATASTEAAFLTDGGTTDLTCGSSNQGKSQVMDAKPFQYCDGATTSVLRYAAYGDSSGVATSATALAANGANCSAGQAPLGVDASGAVEGCFAVVIDGDGSIGEAADFRNSAAGGVDLSGTLLELPNGTASPTAGDCDADAEAGRVYLETDLAGGRQVWVCEGATNGWKQYGDLARGISGGDTLAGGTAAGDNLEIKPSSAANYTGTIKLCSDNPSVGTSAVTCSSIWADGITIGAATSEFSGIHASGTVTHSAQGSASVGQPGAFFMKDSHTQQITDNAINGTRIPGYTSFMSQATLKNATDDNYSTINLLGIGTEPKGFAAIPQLSATSSGNLTIQQWAATYGCLGNMDETSTGAITVTDFFLGGWADPRAFTVNDATITRLWGYYVGSDPASSPAGATQGTNTMPFGAAEATITGTPPSGTAGWGVESGAPNRFFFKNESGHIWRNGVSDWTMASALLGADNGTDYFRPQGFAQAASVAEATVDDVSPPGPMKVFAIACNARVAPANGGGTQTRTCTLRVGTPGSMAASALTCQLSEATQSCTDREEAGVTVGATQVMTIEWAAGSTPADTEVTATIWWNLDAF